MTVCGFEITGLDSGLLWTDSETFSADKPSGSYCKIAINALAGIAGIGCGRIAILRELAAEMAAALSFDEAVLRLPAALRAAARGYRSLEIAALAPLAGSRIGIVGRSVKCGRTVGATFAADDDFEPMLPARSWSMPQVEPPHDVDDVLSAVLRQLSVLRQQTPAATGGGLVVAEVGRDGIRVYPPIDLESGQRWRSRPDTALATAGAGRRGLAPSPLRPAIIFEET